MNRELVDAWQAYAREKGFLWGANCRYNYVGRGRLEENRLGELIGSGLFELGMSIETGDESVRNEVLRKKVEDRDIEEAIRVLKGVGRDRLVVNTSFIIDFPGDTAHSRRRMLPIMDRLSRSLNVVFSGPQVYRPYPGSELFERHQAHEVGQLGYYLASLGAEATSGHPRPNESFFYSHTVLRYYNRRFRRLQEFRDADGRWRVKAEVTARDRATCRAILIEVALWSIGWRIRHDLWACFVEAAILGWVGRVYTRAVHALFDRHGLTREDG
jgi:hypothetical protein